MSDFYKYKVIAKTGDTASNDTQQLTTIQKEVSINNKGQVAFVGNDFTESWLEYNIPKDSIFVWNIGNDLFTNISPNIAASTFSNNEYALTNPTRWFDFSGQGPTKNNAYFEITPGIQINDQGNVLARRIEWNFYGPRVLNNIAGVNSENGQPTGFPTVVPTDFTNKTYSFIEQWDGNQVNEVDAIVQGVGSTVWNTGSYPFFVLPGGIWEGDSLLGTVSNDIITGFQGADRITTGAGEDQIIYTSIVDAGDLITDFNPVNDVINLQGVLESVGFSADDAIAEGYLKLVSYGSRGTSLQIDADGTDGSAIFRPYLFLQGVSVAEINDNPNSLMFG